jgi:hypothetical protein
VLRGAAIPSIARGAEGEILFLAKDAVWVTKGGQVHEVCETSPLEEVTDLLVVTHDKPTIKDWIMVSATEKSGNPGPGSAKQTLYRRKPGGKEFGAIFCSRTPSVRSPFFTKEGRLFFECEGDIWEGDVESCEDEAGSVSWQGVLDGVRVAPLATLSTDMGNAGAMWVQDVAVAGTWIYGALQGHHMGAIVRTKVPAKPVGAPGKLSIMDQYRLMQRSLATVEVVTEHLDNFSKFCVCEVDGKPRVFMTARLDILLLEGNGEPKVIGRLPVE